MYYKVSNKFIKFNIFMDSDENIIRLKSYLEPFVTIEKTDELNNSDLVIFFSFDDIDISGSKKIFINSRLIQYNENKIYVKISSVTNDILFIKRFLIDIINKLFELNNGMFFHSSSVIFPEGTVMFLGEKGIGKTTNMLYLLEKYKVGYSSNEKTGIVKREDGILTFGNPSKINIRIDALKRNHALKDKLWNFIEQDKYEMYSGLILERDCSERVTISYSDLATALGITVMPFGNLKSICNLVYDENTDFKMEKVSVEESNALLIGSSISGIYPNRLALNDLFEQSQLDEQLIVDENINVYNVYHNYSQDNTDAIVRRLKRDF